MNRFAIALAVVAIPVAFLGQVLADDAKKEVKLLEQKWKLAGVQRNGQTPGSFQPFDLVLQPEGKGLFCPVGMQLPITWSIDAKKSPKFINLTKGDNKHFGIYKLEDRKLTVCLTQSGEAQKDRPKSFDTTGTDFTLWIFESTAKEKK